MKRFSVLVLVLVMALAMMACSKGLVLKNLSYDTSQQTLTLKQMREAITRGCIARQWSVTEVDPNTIEASITLRGKHRAVVSIPFTNNHYEIKYKSSANLEYKLKDGVEYIHPHYISWIQNLDNSIQTEIGILKYTRK